MGSSTKYVTQNTEKIVQPKNWTRMFSANTEATAFATIAATLTNPETNATTGAAIFTPKGEKSRLLFFGTDAANETFDVKIVAWSQIGSMWVPNPLALLTVTLGAAVGVAGGDVTDSDLFADTIVEKATTGYAVTGAVIVSPVDNLQASVEIPHVGQQKIGVYFDSTGAASANGLYMSY